MIAIAASIVWWTQPVHAFLGRRQPGDAIDFVVFYAAAKLVASGHSAQLYDLQALYTIERAAHPGLPNHALPIPYFNPPFFALAIAPLAYLSFGHAYQVWTGLKLILLAADCWMIWRITPGLDNRYRVPVLLFFVSLEPVAFSIALGQFSLILATSWTGAYMCFRAGRDRAAGFALAPLLIKPELLIPIVFLLVWKRRLGALRPLTVVTVCGVLVSIALIGVRGLYRYPQFVLSLSAHPGNGVNRRLMFGWNGVLASVMHRQHMAVQAGAYALLCLATLAALAYLWRGAWRRDPASFTKQWVVLTLATVLVDTHFYIQDITLVIPPAIALCCYLQGARRTVAIASLALGWSILALGLIPMREWRINLFSVCMALGILAFVVNEFVERRQAQGAPVQLATAVADAA